jgi:type III pantothenate kinase
MKPDVVVDVGNTRVKWGLVHRSPAGLRLASLPPDDPAAWQQQLDAWELAGPRAWAVSGVHPARRDALVAWLRDRGNTVLLLEKHRQLPLPSRVAEPDRVGIDRLLAAVGANTRRRPGAGAVVVGAGTAITVDLIDPAGAFAGGAILPGVRLMAQSLHDHTALLPVVTVSDPFPPLPGTSTPAAVTGGVYWAAAGAVAVLARELARPTGGPADLFLTGGDAGLLEPAVRQLTAADGPYLAEPTLWPEMILEGVRLAAEAQP